MKVIIPAAGTGSRLRPHTYTTPKTLLHVAGRPILAYLLDVLVQLPNLSEFIFIVGDSGDRIRKYVETHYAPPSTYIQQDEQMGLGHAISLAKERAHGEPVLIVNDDGILEVDPQQIIQSPVTIIGVKGVENPSAFGIVEMEGEFITRLVEKPENPPTNLAIAGMYYIPNSNLLFKCLDELIQKDIRTKNEYQLTDGLQLMLQYGEKMKAARINWLDCGKPDALLDTNRYLLGKHPQNYQLPDAVIIPPVFIADDAVIQHAVIGPYASIGKGAQVINAIVKDSVIHPYADIQNVLISRSLIGESVKVYGHFHRLNIGNSSQIELIDQ
ncbi:NTP transferase domain-containing protein [Candidatus Poribacteria bacterium]|nr:NTP transferase domain-containing protein [Candidatus Poribacteria bacterium]